VARGLSGTLVSRIGFERRHNRALRPGSEDAFVEGLLKDIPPPPPSVGGIVAANVFLGIRGPSPGR
jgi:hypothetical protein